MSVICISVFRASKQRSTHILAFVKSIVRCTGEVVSDSSVILLGGLLLSWLVFVGLDHDQIVVAIRCDHHIVHLAGDSQESQIVLRVQVSH